MADYNMHDVMNFWKIFQAFINISKFFKAFVLRAKTLPPSLPPSFSQQVHNFSHSGSSCVNLCANVNIGKVNRSREWQNTSFMFNIVQHKKLRKSN